MIINANKAKPEQPKSVTPEKNSQTVTPDIGYTLSYVTVRGDSNLVASNIKEDVSIFGVTGTHPDVVTGIYNASGYNTRIEIPEAQGKDYIIISIRSKTDLYEESDVLLSFSTFDSGRSFYLDHNCKIDYGRFSSWNSSSGTLTVDTSSVTYRRTACSGASYIYIAW